MVLSEETRKYLKNITDSERELIKRYVYASLDSLYDLEDETEYEINEVGKAVDNLQWILKKLGGYED